MKTWKYNDLTLDPSDKFIYEVDLFILRDNCWNLENTKQYSCNEFIEDFISYQEWLYPEFKIFKYTTLLYAPLEWLEKNAVLIEYETKKERNKRKREKNGKT